MSYSGGVSRYIWVMKYGCITFRSNDICLICRQICRCCHKQSHGPCELVKSELVVPQGLKIEKLPPDAGPSPLSVLLSYVPTGNRYQSSGLRGTVVLISLYSRKNGLYLPLNK